jgi:LPXTG-site transpeptidase (sortase) family protein
MNLDLTLTDSSKQAWGIRLMMALGLVLLGAGVVRAAAGWQGAGSEELPVAVPVTDLVEAGFAPMLADSPAAAPDSSAWQREPGIQAPPDPAPAHAGWAAVVGEAPVRLVIPSIGLDAPVVGAGLSMIEIGVQRLYQWQAPDMYAAGWHQDTARLAAGGNTVLNGHHNVAGEVFRHLDQLEPGDVIYVFGSEAVHRYLVTRRLILKEKYEPTETRLENAQWIKPGGPERLTLVTCWPYESNTHRLLIVAEPADEAVGGGELPFE